MIKQIKIGEQIYNMKSSAFTAFAYKNETGRDLLEDISDINYRYQEIAKLEESERENAWFSELTPIIEKTLKLAYLMICENDKNFKSYDEWLKELDFLFENIDWIMEVLQLALTPFQSRGIQNTSN